MRLAMLKMMTANGHEFLSDAADVVGKSSVVTAVGITVAQEAELIELASSFGSVWGAFDWLAALAGIGTASFIIKNIFGARKLYLEIVILRIQTKDEDK